MESQGKMNVEEIRKLADDIRVIKNFTENHNFDSSLFSVDVSPRNPTPSSVTESNITFWFFVGSIVIALGCVFANVYFDIQSKHSTLLLLSTLFFSGVATMTAHLKFKNSGATAIIACFLIAVLVIGYGIYTPREVADKAEKLIPGS